MLVGNEVEQSEAQRTKKPRYRHGRLKKWTTTLRKFWKKQTATGGPGHFVVVGETATVKERSLAHNSELLAPNETDVAVYNGKVPVLPIVQLPPHKFFTSKINSYLVYKFEQKQFLSTQIWNRYRHDHPKICGGAMIPPVQPFRFLDLPSEIRRIVYVLVLKRTTALVQHSPDCLGDNVQGPVDVRIFAVNKFVSDEALKVFYQENTLAVQIEAWGGTILPLFIEADTGSNAPRPTQDLKSVHLWIQDFSKGWSYLTAKKLQKVCLVLSRCKKLSEVKITAYCWVYRTGEILDREFDKLLEILTLVRGVKNVMFTDQEKFKEFGLPSHRTIGSSIEIERVRQIMMDRA